MWHGHLHLHSRKRRKKRTRHFLNLDKRRQVKLLDKVCLVFSIIMPATTLPQIWKLYSTQDATGLSLLMWVLYFIAVIPWLFYGIVHKEKPLIVLNTLWLIAQVTIIVGILLYGLY